MRTSAAVLALVLAVGLQRGDAQSFSPGISPRNITFTPVNTSNIVGSQQNLQSFFRKPPQPSSPLNPLNLFRKLPSLSWPPTTANAPVMPQAAPGTPTQQGAAQKGARQRLPMRQPFMMPTTFPASQ